MDVQQSGAGLPPQALRSLALRLLLEAADPSPRGPFGERPVPRGQGELWQALRFKCGELSALVLRADDPGKAAAYLLRYLPKHLDFVFELLFGRKRLPVLGGPEAAGQPVLRE
jgi:hypothetical protein